MKNYRDAIEALWVHLDSLAPELMPVRPTLVLGDAYLIAVRFLERLENEEIRAEKAHEKAIPKTGSLPLKTREK